MPYQPELVRRDHPERRAVRRFPMKLPVVVRVSGVPYEFLAETENISASGIFFYIDRWMSPGAHLEVAIHFSGQVTMSEALEVRLRARVVRVEEPAAGRSGVAAFIEGFRFLPAANDYPISTELAPRNGDRLGQPPSSGEPASAGASSRSASARRAADGEIG
jgi:hypothetical protein